MIAFTGDQLYAQQEKPGMRALQNNYTSLSELQLPTAEILEQYTAFNSNFYENHPEFGRLPFNAPCENCIELFEKRTEFGRYFLDADDPTVFYSQQSNEPLHQFIDDQWFTIDHRLKSTGDRYFSDFPHNQISIVPTQNRVSMTTPTSEFYFNQWTLFGKIGENFNALGAADWSNYTAGDDGLYVTNLFDGIDAELRILRGGVKLNFVIKTNAFPHVEELLFVDAFTANGPPVELEFTDAHGEETAIGELEVKLGGELVAYVGELVVYPENPEKHELLSLPYEITDHALGFKISQELLATVDLGRPLIIDPVVTGANTLAQAAITGSQFNATCDFATSCNHNLTVPAPANATFTDVLTTFDYIAQGACWLEDGATRFTTGGCVSPNQVGFYWFCNLVGGGNCTAENLSLWDDLAGCMPNPSCNEQNVQFTLQFFRSCWGTAGCNNACIGAASPWTMTIVGQTVQHTGVTGGIQMSATSVCSGGELTATATGQNGVPGYTYEWSFNPGGQPVIATGQSVSITFDDPGVQNLYSVITDTCGNESITSVAITVSTGPTPTVSGDTEHCQGEFVELSTGAFSSYQWSTGGNGQTVNATSNDSPVTVTVTDAAGCSATSEPFEITELPAPSVVASPTEQTICDGTSVNVNLSSTTPGTTFSWTVDAQGVVGASSGSGDQINELLSLTGANDGQVIYFVTPSADGCQGTPIEVVVNVGTGIVPIITGESTHCEGESATLSTGEYVSYNWSTGSTEATVDVTSADSPVTVTATDENGCTGTSEPFVVNALPVPEALAITSTTIICSGNAVDIEISSTVPGTVFEFTPVEEGASGASNGAGNQITDVLEATAGNPGSVTYTIVPATADCVGEAIEVTIIVEPLPQPTITGNQTYCSGEPALLSTGAFESYAWSTGSTGQTSQAIEANNPVTVTVTNASGCTGTSDEFIVTEAENVEFSATLAICEGESIAIHGVFQSQPGVYEATFDAGGCDSTAIITLEVLPLPQLTITPSAPVACAGETISLTASGATDYLWNTGAITETIEVSPLQTTLYTVEGSSSDGCTASAEFTLEVGNPDASFSFADDEFCITDANPLPVISGASGGLFSINGGGVIDAQTGQVDLQLSGTGVFDVTYTIAPPCDATETVTITIIDGGIGDTLDGGNYCPNEGVVLLSANGTAGLWSGPGIVDASTGAFDPMLTGPGFFELTFTSTVGCVTNVVEVTVEDELFPAFVFEPEGGCVPATIEFMVLNQADSYTSAQWTFSGGPIALTPTAEVTFQQPGLYDVTLVLTSEAGCVFSATEVGAVNITPQPQPSFSATPQPADLYNTNITFTDQSGNNVVQWDWQFDPANALGASTEPNPSFTFPPGQPGTYPVTLTVVDINGCVGEVTRTVLIRDDFNVFVPNAFTPDNDGVNDVFFVRATDLDPERFTLQIFNRWGEVVFETNDPEQVWDGSVRGGEYYVQNDVYIWRVVAFRKTGFERVELTGSVTIIR